MILTLQKKVVLNIYVFNYKFVMIFTLQGKSLRFCLVERMNLRSKFRRKL